MQAFAERTRADAGRIKALNGAQHRGDGVAVVVQFLQAGLDSRPVGQVAPVVHGID